MSTALQSIDLSASQTDDDLDAGDRERLHAAILRGAEQLSRGDFVTAEHLLAELDADDLEE